MDSLLSLLLCSAWAWWRQAAVHSERILPSAGTLSVQKKSLFALSARCFSSTGESSSRKIFSLGVVFFSEYMDCDGKQTQQQRRNSRLWDYCSQKEPRLQPGDGDDISAQWHDPKIPTRWAWCWHGVNIFFILFLFDRAIIQVSHKQQKNTDYQEKTCDKRAAIFKWNSRPKKKKKQI